MVAHHHWILVTIVYTHSVLLRHLYLTWSKYLPTFLIWSSLAHLRIFCNLSLSSYLIIFHLPQLLGPKQSSNTVRLQMNGAVSKVNKKFISHLTRAKRIPSAAATVLVSHALPAVRFSCLLRGRGVSFKDGAAAGKGFLCAPF